MVLTDKLMGDDGEYRVVLLTDKHMRDDRSTELWYLLTNIWEMTGVQSCFTY